MLNHDVVIISVKVRSDEDYFPLPASENISFIALRPLQFLKEVASLEDFKDGFKHLFAPKATVSTPIRAPTTLPAQITLVTWSRWKIRKR